MFYIKVVNFNGREVIIDLEVDENDIICRRLLVFGKMMIKSECF